MVKKPIVHLSAEQRKNNRLLRRLGYGWERTKIVCQNCRWKGRRIWGPKMFSKPCPKCKKVWPSGKTTVWSPNYIKVRGRRIYCC